MLACMVGEVEREQTSVANHHLRLISKACLLTLSTGSSSEFVTVLREQLPALGVPAYCVARFPGQLGVTRELEIVARRVTGVWQQKLSKVPTAELGLDPAFETEEALVVQPLVGHPSARREVREKDAVVGPGRADEFGEQLSPAG